MNILLVEDDYWLGRCTAHLLEKSGQHHIRLTHKAADIFRQCQAGNIDLVIMDVNLPGTFWQGKEVSGLDLSRLLKQQAQTKHVPVVLLAADSMHADRNQLLSYAAADCWCTKPIGNPEHFLALLERVYVDSQLQGLTASAS